MAYHVPELILGITGKRQEESPIGMVLLGNDSISILRPIQIPALIEIKV